MAWRASSTSNAGLVENMCRSGLITIPRVKEVFLKVDRRHYAPSNPYEDSPQYIGHGATISAPHMHATAAQYLLPYLSPHSNNGAAAATGATATRQRRPRVLDIGSGSGYLTHILAELAGPNSFVVGLEHIAQLRDLGEANMRKSEGGRAALDEGRVIFRVGDGRKGWREPPVAVSSSPADAAAELEGDGDEDTAWDAIHVGASAKELHPELIRQLRSPGRMFIPVNDDSYGGSQSVWTVDKDEHGTVTKKRLFGVQYVPLTDPPTP